MTSMSAEARAEYLKRYLDPPKEKKKKKTKNTKNFRIIEEDTFLPIKEEKAAKKQKVEDSEDEADALLRAAQNAKELEATKFKAATFVSVNNGGDEAQPSNVRTIAKPNGSQPVLRTGRTRDSHGEDLDALPLRRQAGQRGNDSDASSSRPSRMSGRRADNSDASPPRRRPGKGSNSDASPPRRRNADGHKRCESDSDASPPRRRDEKDRSPRRRQIKREALDCDLDHSPPRSEPRRSNRSPQRRRQSSPARVVAAAKVERRSDSDKSPAVSDDDEEGHFAAPRKRVTLFNRRRRNGKEPEDPEKKARESAKQKELDAKYAQWSKGIEQAKEREAKLKEMSEVAQENFTRYADDEAMNAYLKEQIYDLDPMANFYRTKQQKIEMKTSVVYPKYTGHWPPNRFSIAPGYRWDGVDRSNGFETKMAGAENRRKAEETIAYRSITECEE